MFLSPFNEMLCCEVIVCLILLRCSNRHYIIIIFKHLTSVFLTDIYTTTLTISTSLVLYLYMDTWKIK